jgi:hypothetical protein
MMKCFIALPSATLLSLIFFGTLDGNADQAGNCTNHWSEDSAICENFRNAGADLWKYTKCMANANAHLTSCMQKTSGGQANQKGGTTATGGTKGVGRASVFGGTRQPPSDVNKFGGPRPPASSGSLQSSGGTTEISRGNNGGGSGGKH